MFCLRNVTSLLTFTLLFPSHWSVLSAGGTRNGTIGGIYVSVGVPAGPPPPHTCDELSEVGKTVNST